VRLAHLLTGVDAMAEDLAQESFTRIEPRWQAIENPHGYLRTTVVSRCRSWQRSRGREAARMRRLGPLVRTVEDPRARELLDAVGALPFRQRAVLVLRYYHDLPEDEIAAALGCRPGTVKSLSARALQPLRKVVER
jgi:RNA polymerase sigma factor (sigma-70 family)